MRSVSVIAALALLLFAAAVEADRTTIERTGYAYELGKDRLLYTEEHEEHQENGKVARSEVTYRDPDGEVIATKRLDFSSHATGPDFRLENLRNGHLEGAERQGDVIRVFFRRTGNDGLKEHELRPPGDAIIDGGFDRFIEMNWGRLLQGEAVKRPFLVPSFHRFLDFRIYLERKTDTEVVFIMEPASMFLRLFADGIVVSYDRDSGALRLYEGTSNIRDQDGENYEVRVEFPAAGQSGDVAGGPYRDRRQR